MLADYSTFLSPVRYDYGFTGDDQKILVPYSLPFPKLATGVFRGDFTSKFFKKYNQ